MEVNPLKAARTSLGLAIEQVADRAFLSKRAVLNYEHGLYNSPPVGLLRVLELNDIKLARYEYGAWQDIKRRESLPLLERAVAEWSDGDWYTFRSFFASSRLSFCKFFCMNPGVIETFERSIKTRDHITPYMWEFMFVRSGADDGVMEEFKRKMARNGN